MKKLRSLKKINIVKILDLLKNNYKESMLSSFRKKYNKFQILVAAFLSTRTKDETTIKVCKELFKEFKKPEDFIKINVYSIEKKIYGIGFYKVKAKRLRQLSKIIIEKYKGKIPSDINELIKLPGIGRKVANCVLAYAYGKPAIVVDVHVHRIANRLGIVKTKNVFETEKELEKITPKKYWNLINELFVVHGQNICKARKPICKKCPIKKFCDFYLTNIQSQL